MRYESTRGSLDKKRSTQAIIQGIAEDGGLFVPSEIPKLPDRIVKALQQGKALTYKETAEQVMGQFFDDYEQKKLNQCIESAYDQKFVEKDVVKLCKIENSQFKHVNFLELYHGKTAAFKDVALSILPYLMVEACKEEGEKSKICVLTATSGDTGKAALEGFCDVPGTEIIVFYPKDGVSLIQERQMVSQEGKNTHVFAIEGNFDDAQSGVKSIFADNEFKSILADRGVMLSSANSINIGRLVPQIVYYVYSYMKLVEEGQLKNGEPMNVAVPTGNFGNILAAYFAKEMGVPIKKLICASNENNVLTDFIQLGKYDIRGEKRSFRCTNSPSMDILISSNLERLLYLLSDRDSKAVCQWMQDLNSKKHYNVAPEFMSNMTAFEAGYATQEETLGAIGELWNNSKYLADTHTAVAYKVYCDYVSKTGDCETPVVIASTASPYKFAESVATACGLDQVDNQFECLKKLNQVTGQVIPYGLVDLDKKAVLHSGIVSKDAMKGAVLEALK